MQVRFADCELDTDARQLVRGGQEMHLSPKAFELLKVLVEHRPRALSKQELLDKIWPGVFVSDASLARAASEIRDAIDDHSRSDGFLQTVHGFGYRFATTGVVLLPERGADRAPDQGVDSAARHADGPACWLVGRDCEFRLGDGEHIVGREPGVAVRLDSPKVSRHHARVTVTGREVSIEDLGSKNGTFVRGVRIEEPTRLSPGNDIQIGPIKLIFRIVEALGGTETEVWSQDST